MKRFLIAFVTVMLNLFPFALASTEIEIPINTSLKFKNFIDNIAPKQSKLQGGTVAILYKGQVVYKTTFGYQKGHKKLITDRTFSQVNVNVLQPF